jgi:hypothetical protein
MKFRGELVVCYIEGIHKIVHVLILEVSVIRALSRNTSLVNNVDSCKPNSM